MESFMDGLEPDGRFDGWIEVRCKVSWMDLSRIEGFMDGLESNRRLNGWIGVRWEGMKDVALTTVRE